MLDIRPRDASGTPAAWYHFWPLLMGPAAVGAVALTQRLLSGPSTLLVDGLGAWEWYALSAAAALLVVCLLALP